VFFRKQVYLEKQLHANHLIEEGEVLCNLYL
jgi:hypothetical protein